MKINQDNYEQYFLDHAEGSLSPEMERELEDFLQSNPDLKAVLEDYDANPLPSPEIHNEELKKRLKRDIIPTQHINGHNAEEWMISQVEGLLNDNEEAELAEFITLNPAYAYDREKFSQTRLSADLSITYSRKEQLKKKAPVLPIIRLAWLIPAAAAVILLFFGIRYLLKPDDVIIYPAPGPVADVVKQSGPANKIPEAKTKVNRTVARVEIQSPAATSKENPSQINREASFRLEPTNVVAIEIALVDNLENINLFVFNVPPIQPEEQKKKSLFSKVVGNMVAQAKEGLSRQAKFENFDKSDFSLWTLARAGVNGYNSISDREIELYVHRDEEGKVTSYALIEEDRLLMEKNLEKN
jgi:hypothetical protein